jgi:alpha-mannosidase
LGAVSESEHSSVATGSSAEVGTPAEGILLFDSKNVIVDTIKPADTEENALMVRVYESMGMQTDSAFVVHPAVKRVVETDMLEENPVEVSVDEKLQFRQFEIKTLLLYL